MADRKQTPDILAEILGGEPPAAELPAPEKTKKTAPPAKRTPPAARPKREVSARPAAAVKWEHRMVSFQHYQGWRPRFIDGKAVRNWTEGPVIHEFITQMGEEGWDLVSACSGVPLYGSLDKYQLIFKRPQ